MPCTCAGTSQFRRKVCTKNTLCVCNTYLSWVTLQYFCARTPPALTAKKELGSQLDQLSLTIKGVMNRLNLLI